MTVMITDISHGKRPNNNVPEAVFSGRLKNIKPDIKKKKFRQAHEWRTSSAIHGPRWNVYSRLDNRRPWPRRRRAEPRRTRIQRRIHRWAVGERPLSSGWTSIWKSGQRALEVCKNGREATSFLHARLIFWTPYWYTTSLFACFQFSSTNL